MVKNKVCGFIEQQGCDFWKETLLQNILNALFWFFEYYKERTLEVIHLYS